MPVLGKPRIAIIDFGLGNLYSIQQACHWVGMQARISNDIKELDSAEALLLPGVGSFGKAMDALKRLDLVNFLQDYSAGQKPLIGICLGMQLLMAKSEEFGQHPGLGIVAGEVVRFEQPGREEFSLKIPQIGWNSVYTDDGFLHANSNWNRSPLAGLADGRCMYFVHSYFVKPTSNSVVASLTTYGGVTYCSSLLQDNTFACQFHPERSGPDGLHIYSNIAAWIMKTRRKH